MAQIASGRRKGLMMTPAVARPMVLQARRVSCGGIVSLVSGLRELFGSDTGSRPRCLPRLYRRVEMRAGFGQRRPDALCRDDGALRDVETAGVTHEIGDDNGKNRAEDAGTDSGEKLHPDQ